MRQFTKDFSLQWKLMPHLDRTESFEELDD